MHNVNVDALKETIIQAESDPSAAVQPVSFDGQWPSDSGPQFTATIPVPNGRSVAFEAWSCAPCAPTRGPTWT